MATDAEIGRAFRRYVAGLERPQGASAPESLGNQADPVMSTSGGERSGRVDSGRISSHPDRDDRGPAWRGAANSFGWLWQDRACMKGYREHMIFAKVDAGGTATIDPDAAANFWFDCAGSVTLAFASTEDEPVMVVDADGNAVLSQTSLVTVYVNRVKDATVTFPAGIKWSSSVTGGTPVGPATGPTEDVFTFQLVPGKGWRGYVTGAGMV